MASRDIDGGCRQCARQELANRALVIAAAGAHNLLMLGPPGSGKTMYITRHRREYTSLRVSISWELSHEGVGGLDVPKVQVPFVPVSFSSPIPRGGMKCANDPGILSFSTNSADFSINPPAARVFF